MGKRPVVSDQDPAFDRYLRSEFEGGKPFSELEASIARRAPVTEPAPPESPAAPVRARPPVEAAARDLRRTKPVRVPQKA